jgi:hypothetical protein
MNRLPRRLRSRPYTASRGAGRESACARLAAGAAIWAVCGLDAQPGFALDAEVAAETAAQFYEVRSPSGQTLLTRRRFLTTLAVGAYPLNAAAGDSSSRGALYFFRTRARYDSDYGALASEASPTSLDRYVPGLERGPIDLMYAYVEGQRLLGGALGFKLGRQYLVDSLGWWALDGASVRVVTPVYVAASLYGGFETRGGLPLTSPRFERDGVFRGNRDLLDPRVHTSFLEQGVAPAYGASIETVGLGLVHAQVGYRRVENRSPATIDFWGTGARPAVTQTRVSQERIGGSLNLNFDRVLGAKAGATYDVLNQRFASGYASIDGYLSKRITLSADWDFVQPSFDGDSIWNSFYSVPVHTIAVSARIEAHKQVSLAFGSTLRVFGGPQTTPVAATPNALAGAFTETVRSFNAGGHAAVRVQLPSSTLGLRSDASTGPEGYRVGTDIFAETRLDRRVLLGARASLWSWNDTARPDRDATSIGYVGTVGYLTGSRSDVRMEFEHNANRLVGQRYRLLFWFNLAVTK